jgi:aspartyl-tRNA(Asn)/glutamyl-tRNA(Gln) amidotransferase subunit A
MKPSAQELAFAPLAALAEAIQCKQVSPVELVKASLARIEALDPKLNSFYTLFRDDALEAARAGEAEIARGEYRGALHGIPIGIKDIYECGPTTCGSQSLKSYVAAEDCVAVRKLKQAGAIVVGKNATYEFAYGFPTTKSYFKPARNPWNLAYDAGGSSSGSAASVSAGLVYASMGSCTGGSIRWPAQCCGIVGLKATYGRVSRAGVYPLAWSLDHTGPLARTVRDAALVLQGCAGYDPSDPASAKVPVPDFTAHLGEPIKGMRIGLMRSVYEDNCDPKVLGPFHSALNEFEKLGAKLLDVPSITLTQLQAIEWPALFTETAAIHLDNVRNHGAEYNPHARLFVAYGLLISGASYLMAQRARAQVRDALLGSLTRDVDVLMLPTVGFPVSPVLEDSPGLSIVAEDFSVYTALFNFTGFPAIQVPCGFDNDGLPVGLQIAGRPFEEATICQVAHAYEQATPWHDKHPSL